MHKFTGVMKTAIYPTESEERKFYTESQNKVELAKVQ